MYKVMIGLIFASVLNFYGCDMSMKPHKTTVSATYGQDEVDKANDSKDQTKNSMQVTVKQEFLWNE